jgi:hypothetical protein
MPSISPERLSRQIEELASQIHSPAEFRRRAVDLLVFYADRTRRPVDSSLERDHTRILSVPRPVLRNLRQRLQQISQVAPKEALLAADELWEAGYQETRVLAAQMIGGLGCDRILDKVQTWVLDVDDPVIHSALAVWSLNGCRAADQDAFLAACLEWLRENRLVLIIFGLLALTESVKHPDFSDLPAVFRLLQGATLSPRSEFRRAYLALISSLAGISHHETARFLLDLLQRKDPQIERLVRSAIVILPIEDQKLILSALSTP